MSAASAAGGSVASDGDPSRASRHYGALARGAGLPLPIRHSAHVRLTFRACGSAVSPRSSRPTCAASRMFAPDELIAALTDGRPVRVCSRKDLIEMKRPAGRSQDLHHLEQLGAG